jgi:hypothetical protein
MIKPITTIAVLAFSLSAFAQTQTIKVKSRGEDVRTVIDSIFDQAGKHYVLETNYHQTLYMNLEGISFQKAIDIIAKVSDMEFEEKDGIWYIHKKTTTSAQSFATTKSTTATNPIVKPVTKTKAPAKSPTFATKTSTKVITAPQPFVIEKKPVEKGAPKVNLTGRLTVQLRKMDIREVFSEFGRQTKIDIQIDETVPSYKLDAFFYNTTLKFALDKVCKVAGLKYVFTPTNTVLISKAKESQ